MWVNIRRYTEFFQPSDRGCTCLSMMVRLYVEMAQRCPTMWEWAVEEHIFGSLEKLRSSTPVAQQYQEIVARFNALREQHLNSTAGFAPTCEALHVRMRKDAKGSSDATELLSALQRCMFTRAADLVPLALE